MAPKLLPLKLPNANVAPARSGDPRFRLSDNEKSIFDLFAKEQVDIIGSDIDYYSLNSEKGKRDPLYDEPLTRHWSNAFRLKAWVSWASSTPVTGEEGFHLLFNATCWIARAELERVRCPAPDQGDVLRFWNNPFFNQQAASGDKIDNAGYYFDVLNADNDGHINDSMTFVGFRLDIRRRAEFGAERRISPP